MPIGLKRLFFGGRATTALKDIESIYPLNVTTKGGGSIDLASYRGKIVLIVNTASKCGFTKQFDALEKLYRRYQQAGLVVLGFPSGDFAGQELGSDEEIGSFCRINFGVSFEIFPKGAVTGSDAQPLFQGLTTRGPNELRGPVRWNFEKFLLDREGRLVARWRSWVNPLWGCVEQAIKDQLALA